LRVPDRRSGTEAPAVDNLTHTLAGLALARAGLGRTTPLATTALVAGANLPDVDLLWSGGTLAYVHFHRGWTHALAGVGVGTLVLWAALLALDRTWIRRREARAGRARAGPLLLASFLGVASHAALDGTNAYGLRPFLPWSDRWVYGDLWFILDPWLWLLLGAAAFLAGPRGRPEAVVLGTLGAGAAALLVVVPGVPLAAGLLFPIGLAGVVLAARRIPVRCQGAGRVLLALVVVYAALGLGSGTLARARLQAIAAESLAAGTPVSSAALPRPADPFRWDGLLDTPDAIFHGVVGCVASLDPADSTLMRYDRGFDDPRVASLLASCPGRVLLAFYRFPFARVEEEPDGGASVVLRDARFAREGRRRFGVAGFRLDEKGMPKLEGIPCPGPDRGATAP
jgi:inner membrane protein